MIDDDARVFRNAQHVLAAPRHGRKKVPRSVWNGQPRWAPSSTEYHSVRLPVEQDVKNGGLKGNANEITGTIE